ncbi:hypothetical protein Taro_013807 [Colocasia esculenta]|uniref:Uncharacterized protein n=1 Tax=Colocasia esculenta TaxID=4460 RepID=A0A843UCX6_COLES|nr:hypothetical protein [Colocasia esculenta]
MQSLRRRVAAAIFSLSGASPSPSPSSSWGARTLTYHRAAIPAPEDPAGTLASPWSAIQRRGAKVLGSDVRLGNIIQRKGLLLS